MLDNVAQPGADAGALKNAIQQQLSTAFELSHAAVFGSDLALAEVISASPRMVNSVDFMEACAKVANGFRKSHGVSIRLPAFSLDMRMSAIVDSFFAQVSESLQPASTGAAVEVAS